MTTQPFRYYDPFEGLKSLTECHKAGREQLRDTHRFTLESYLISLLPTGNGINDSWHFMFEDAFIKAYNAFECFDESGKSEEWLPFFVIITPGFHTKVKFRCALSRHLSKVKPELERRVEAAVSEAHARLWAFKLINYFPDILREVQADSSFSVIN